MRNMKRFNGGKLPGNSKHGIFLMVERMNSRVIMVFSIWRSTMKYMAKTLSKSQKIKQFLEKQALSICGKVPVYFVLSLHF